jgi:transcriptional regulator with XRE-family HTH domain
MEKAIPINNIKAERVRKGLSQCETAKKLGISTTSYNQKESGKVQFKLDEFIHLCHVLGTDPETLLNGLF